MNWLSLLIEPLPQPLIKEANEQAQIVIVEAIRKCREEVNFPPLEKAKWIQSMIANELDQLPSTVSNVRARVSLLRELRGWFDIENKLSGSYQTDEKFQIVIHVVIRIENVINRELSRNASFKPDIKELAQIGAEDFGIKAEDVEREYLKRQRLRMVSVE